MCVKSRSDDFILSIADRECVHAVSRNLYTLSIVLGWIGFILNTAIFLLYLLNPILRKWPIHCVIALAAVLTFVVLRPQRLMLGALQSQAVFAFGLVMSTFVDRRDLLCKGGDVRRPA